MLYLNKGDIKKCINYQELIGEIENALTLYNSGKFVMPDRITETFGEETYLYMPCFTDEVKGTKILTLYQENSKKNIPVIQGIMILNDPETGNVQCILDGATLTAIRTGAVGGTGIKHTTRESSKSLGIVGAGVQGIQQAIFGSKIRKLENIYVTDLNKESCEKFVTAVKKELPDINVEIAKDSKELVEKSDIIITATPSPKPVLPDDKEILRGKHFIGIGSYKPTMIEYPESIYSILDKIYVDVEFAKEESGDLTKPIEEKWFKDENIVTISEGISKNNINLKDTTFFKTVGMAMFDTFIANYIYKKAVELGLGQDIVE